MKTYKVGDYYPGWWGGGTIVAIYNYTGKYTNYFSHVFRVTSNNTKRGWVEIAIEPGHVK